MSVKDKSFPQAFHDFNKSNGADHLIYNDEPSLTRQEFAEECDINALMARYEKHGMSVNHLLAMPAQGGQYLDFTEMPTTLQEYMTFMHDAEAKFMTLPAHVRKEFDNNPIDFVEFASDPDNLDQMRKWELAPPAPAEKAVEEPAPPAAPGAPPAAPGAQAGSSAPGTHVST